MFFSLYWGMWLHLHTSGEVVEAIPEVPDGLIDEGRLYDAIRQVGPKVPLVTAAEFRWEGRLDPWE